jgi:hypothetical protein
VVLFSLLCSVHSLVYCDRQCFMQPNLPGFSLSSVCCPRVSYRYGCVRVAHVVMFFASREQHCNGRRRIGVRVQQCLRKTQFRFDEGVIRRVGELCNENRHSLGGGVNNDNQRACTHSRRGITSGAFVYRAVEKQNK